MYKGGHTLFLFCKTEFQISSHLPVIIIQIVHRETQQSGKQLLVTYVTVMSQANVNLTFYDGCLH